MTSSEEVLGSMCESFINNSPQSRGSVIQVRVKHKHLHDFQDRRVIPKSSRNSKARVKQDKAKARILKARLRNEKEKANA